MTRNHLLAITPVLLCLAAPIQVHAAEKSEKEAQVAAELWLAQVDAGKYAESWKNTAPIFQSSVTQAQWQSALDSVRKPLGSVVSRKLKSAKYTKNLPGAPSGEYVVLQFDTSFTNKKDAIETVTPMLDTDKKWKVSGYFIK